MCCFCLGFVLMAFSFFFFFWGAINVKSVYMRYIHKVLWIKWTTEGEFNAQPYTGFNKWWLRCEFLCSLSLHSNVCHRIWWNVPFLTLHNVLFSSPFMSWLFWFESGRQTCVSVLRRISTVIPFIVPVKTSVWCKSSPHAGINKRFTLITPSSSNVCMPLPLEIKCDLITCKNKMRYILAGGHLENSTRRSIFGSVWGRHLNGI